MKKNILSEEISRIKNIIGKVMNESFDDMDDEFGMGDEFDTEENPLDYDETDDYQDDFSPKLKQKQLKNKMKLDVNYGVPSYSSEYKSSDLLYKEKMKDYNRDKRDYGHSVEPPELPKYTGKPIEPYNPIQSNDIPLEKYLALKRDAMFRGDNKIKYK
jgi:hypothetical protein